MLPFLQKRKSHFGALSNFSVLSLLQMDQQAFIAFLSAVECGIPSEAAISMNFLCSNSDGNLSRDSWRRTVFCPEPEGVEVTFGCSRKTVVRINYCKAV